MNIESNYSAVAPRKNTEAPPRVDLKINHADAFGIRDIDGIRNALAVLIARAEGTKNNLITNRVDELLVLSDDELDKKYKEVVAKNLEITKSKYELEYYNLCSDNKLYIIYKVKEKTLGSVINMSDKTYSEYLAELLSKQGRNNHDNLKIAILKQIIRVEEK